MLLKKAFIACMIALLPCAGIVAQTDAGKTSATQLSGVVKDKAGELLTGVSVQLKGTTTGTVTDVDGKFSLNVSGENAVLVFSYVGYAKQEVKTGTKKVFNVTLDDSSLDLDEVVVVGYGTQRRRDLTGSVSSIGEKQLKDIPVMSAAQAITGKLSGVQVTQADGELDAEIKIRVRGGGSITQDNSPLYLVDGFPVDDINDIAPTDIASIDVLKDASSTAIYGARGANGVIIVTTKKGSEGKATVKYNAYFGIKKVTRYLDVLDPREYVYWQWEAMLQGQNGNGPEKLLGAYQDIDLYDEMTPTNWQKEIFGRTGTSLYNNLSISGGTKAAKYNVSLTRNDDKDIMLGAKIARTNLSANTTFIINKAITANMNLRLSDSDQTGAGLSGSRLNNVIQFRPAEGLMAFIDEDLLDPADFENSTTTINPVKQTNDDYRQRIRQTFVYNGDVSIKLLPTLTYRFSYGYQYQKKTEKRFYGLNTSNAFSAGKMPIAFILKTDGNQWSENNTLTWQKKNFIARNHNLTVMAGEELSAKKDETLFSSGQEYPKYISRVSALSMMQQAGKIIVGTSDNPGSKISSFFGRVNYDYKGRYLFSGTFRADGSSKFAQGNQWGYFPAASGAWRVSDEDFMKPSNNWLSNLKLRLSYGAAGNNRIDDNVWRKTFSGPDMENIDDLKKFTLFFNESTMPTFILTPDDVLSNPELKWETTITRNLGIDFGFFRQRLSGSVELYSNTTKDLLIMASIPANVGYTRQWQNIGQTSNRGVEISLDAEIIKKRDFRLSTSLNIAFNKSHIDKLNYEIRHTSGWAGSSFASNAPQEDFYVREGGKVGLMYGYVTDGFYTFDDFDYHPAAAGASTSPYKGGLYTFKETLVNGEVVTVADNSALLNPRMIGPGMLKFKDLNGDHKIDDQDKQVIGDANPLHTGGFSLTSQYKSFDLSVFFNWVYGNDIYNAGKLMYSTDINGKHFKNMLGFMNADNRFTYYNQTDGTLVTDIDQLRDMNANATMWQGTNSSIALHSWAIEDGSFLRLNNVTIGYSVPKRLLLKFRLEQLRLYVTGYNLYTWTRYSGYDPEVDVVRNPLSPGIDYNAYPRSKTFNIGLNLTF